MWQEINKKIKELEGEEMYKLDCGLVKPLGYHEGILYLECPDGSYANNVNDYIKKAGYTGKIEWSCTSYTLCT